MLCLCLCLPQECPDYPVADYPTFLQAWRVELPWLVVCKSVSMFVRCGVCEYLKLLIDQTPRNQGALRDSLRARLGAHFQFQAAQRLAQGRLEEECAQSGATKWFMKIDKMDQKKTVTPTVWSQLATPLFRDLDKRLVTGLIGSMWHGTQRTTHLVRSVFDDCDHGSEMQCSAMLQNLVEVATCEGHLPSEWHIGADNTYKETKNQVCFWFAAWLLCVLAPTNLWMITFSFLLVGHTHDALDRFFSRLVAAISGRDLFAVDEVFATADQKFNYVHLKGSHLAQTWKWKELLGLPIIKGVSGLGPVHAIKMYRSNGIWVQWKQWMTDEDWCRPVLLVPAEDMATLANFMPSRNVMTFPNGGQTILDWIDKFAHWCGCLNYPGMDSRVSWLRAAVQHALPGVYTPGMDVATLVRKLLELPSCRPDLPPDSPRPSLPQDIVTQLFPGSDVPSIPAENLIRIEGLTPATRSTIITPGSLLVVRTDNAHVDGHKTPFLVAVAAQTPTKHLNDEKLLVAWWLPPLSKAETFRPVTNTPKAESCNDWHPRFKPPHNALPFAKQNACKHTQAHTNSQSLG